MDGYEYQSDFARKYVAQGREEGRREGRREGREEGREEGRRETLIAAILRLAARKMDTLPTGVDARLRSTPDPVVLEEILLDLGVTGDAESARAVLARFV